MVDSGGPVLCGTEAAGMVIEVERVESLARATATQSAVELAGHHKLCGTRDQVIGDAGCDIGVNQQRVVP